jgi:sortase A
VVEKEVLKSTAIEEMEAGEWDLTLFTCTIGGADRITIRCEKTE